MRINSIGLRDREFADAKVAGRPPRGPVRRLICRGLGRPYRGPRVSRQLEACLQREGASVEVANFGVAGYGTDQALLFFEQQGRALWGR